MPSDPRKRLSAQVSVKVTRGQKCALEAKAREEGATTFADWVREKLLSALEK